jgi:hypothetical protein
MSGGLYYDTCRAFPNEKICWLSLPDFSEDLIEISFQALGFVGGF